MIWKVKSCQATHLVAVNFNSSGGGLEMSNDGVRHLGLVCLECDVSYMK